MPINPVLWKEECNNLQPSPTKSELVRHCLKIKNKNRLGYGYVAQYEGPGFNLYYWKKKKTIPPTDIGWFMDQPTVTETEAGGAPRV